MRLFVWEGVFTDWTDGLAIAVAEDEDAAREAIRVKMGFEHVHDDLLSQPLWFDLDTLPAPIAFFVYGGG